MSEAREYRPLVSVVIPVYNGANYMREAIESALNQTYEHIEVIVVNDGSTDGGVTEEIALSYGPRIRYFRKVNGGCASALNLGIQEMRGDWFSWLSHDDVYTPGKVASAVRLVAEEGLDPMRTVLSCGSSLIDASGNEIPRISLERTGLLADSQAFDWLLRGHTPNGCGLLIPRAAIEMVGAFNTKHVYILDWEYWVKLALTGHAFRLYPDRLVKNRRHGAQVSVNAAARQQGEVREFANELVTWVTTHCDRDIARVQSIWLYCSRIGAKEELARIEQYMSCADLVLPRSAHLTGRWRRTKHVAKSYVRRLAQVAR